MVYEGLSGGGGCRPRPRGRTRGIFMATARLLFLFATRNRACGELAGDPKNILPLFCFISSLSGHSFHPTHPALFIRRTRRSTSRVFARPYTYMYIYMYVRAVRFYFPSRSSVPPSSSDGGKFIERAQKKNSGARTSIAREDSFYLRACESARVL